ncbi:alkane 1-monooxygenase [Pseudorhodobacter wandonensis]|uniref:alkane 1-monooxygenase n=1 Tax=Pseudorhodobacter wandonensis TaxID=1120568 RepID=UPI0009E28C52|nr:alkane 1-monooxygenase [Pseudorhodobacter wandonensis]
MPRMPLFAFAALTPLWLIAIAVPFGGPWVVLAVLYMGLFTALLDQFIPLVIPDAAEGAEFPAADALLVVLALGHLIAFPIVVWAVAGPSGMMLWERVLLLLAAGQWFGQVSNPCAHELIHRGNRAFYALGVVVYATMLFGHHASAHRLVHHRHAASMQDPNTARQGESFYHFWRRAWVGSYRAGLRAETERRAGKAGLHPYAVYALISAVSLGAGFALAGVAGVAVWLLLAVYGHSQLLLADYVQHYGLLRATLPNGKLEPVNARHSWNALQWYSSALMLNAPRHSDHHAHPNRPYPALRLPARDDAPYLPYPLPLCCALALAPRLWQRMMAKSLRKWHAHIAVTGNPAPDAASLASAQQP